MLRYLIFRAGSASLGFMLMLPLGHGASRPTGFDETPTPGERQLAAAAVPDGYFREMTGLWHGAPGLEALQTRWRTFAATEPGFAVLAALVEESAGRPQVALEQMKLLPGSGARWQEGRLLALLGREGEAVAVLEKLVAEGEDLGVAAEALLALTELDCIRGEFARGLVRSGGAWQGRVEEGFRLKILERHLSLLVEAGQERDFLEGQLAVANGEGVKEVRETARKVLTVMADWFTGDARLREIQKEMGRDFYTGVAGARMPGMVHLRPSLSCGVLHPRGSEVVLELLAANSTEEVESALEKAPVWRERLKAQPLQMAVHLLQWDQQRKGLPGVARWMVGAVEAGPVRRAVELIERAWAGKAGPEDVEVLSGIIVEAGRARGMRPAYPLGRSGKGMAFVGLDDYPSAEIVWNLQGPRWAEFYAMSCRCFPLFKITHGDNHFEAAKFGGWSDWRPSWPVDGVEPLTVWAWRQLLLCGQGTRERAERIAQQMGDAGDRVLFAALCRQDALLVKWLQEKEFVREVNSSALMQALNTLQLGMGDARPSEAQAEVVLTVAREMARRLELPPLDLIRMNERFYRFASPSMREEMAARPVDPVLAAILDGHYDDHAVQALRRQRSVAPYPLYNLPLCPSVERFRALAVALEKPRPGTYVPTGHFGMPRPALELLLGWAYRSRDYFLNLPATLQEIAEFPSKHPLKQSVQKWRQAMPVVERKGGAPFPLPDRPDEEGVAMLTTLRQVAGELKASLEWDLAGVLLEENPDEAVKRLEALRARSPLTAGVGLSPEPAPESPPREMVRPKGAEVAEHFLKLTKDPEFQRTLEPVGAMGRFMTPSSSNSSAFQTRLREMAEEEIPAFAQRLLEAKDPLAARLAVCVAGGGKRYKEGADWARKALERVPDDPEILLALAARLDAKDPEARSAFLRALERIKVFHVPQEKEGWSWCGIQSNTRWSDAEVADAIAAFAERVKPPVLPIDWARTLESAIINREELAKLKNVQSVVLAAVRYRKPWREGEGDHPGWMSVLEALTAAGKAETAAVVAETLLSHPEGSLGRPGEFSEPAFPWINSSTGQVTGPAAEGWKYLLRAERNDPAGLANRLQVVSSVHAGDEQIAFAALLARGRERSLTVEDLKILDALKPAGRHRALAYASWLLPPDRLPVALLLEAWVAEAVVEFSDVGNGCRNFLQGIAYLDRLEAAGAKDSVQRCLPALVESIKTLGSFPDDFPQSLVQRLQRLGSSELVERMYRLLSERVLTKPEGADTYDDLEMVLKAYYDDPQAPTLPEEIAQRVTAALERAVAGQTPDAWARHYFLFRVASYAVADERWQPVLRQLLERQGPELFKSREGAGWRNIAALLGVLKSASLVPDVRARLIPTAEGQGTLTWAFLGIRPPPPPANSQRVSQAEKNNLRGWPALAKKLAGKFDAIILVSEAENGVAPTGETIVARVERFPANGEIPLTGLPRIGRLRILLFQREAPLAFTEVGPLGYNTLPLLFDTAQPPAPRPHDPPGWQLLSEPRELTASASWLIDNATDRWPSGLALLLLDEDNEICAATELRPEVSAANPELAGFAGVFVKQHQFTSPRLNQKTAVLRTVGPPRRLVLARSNQGNEKEDEKSDWGLLPRITVQEWPVEPGPPLAGKFEIVRLWHLPNQTGRAGAPALRLDPLQVAWYAEDRLHVLDLEKNAPPRELDLKLNPGFRFRSIFWHDARLHLHFQDPRDESTTLLLSLDTAQAEPVPDMYEFPGANINIQGPEAHNIPGVTLIYRKKELLGLLSPEGKYLQLAAALDPLAASPLYPQTLLTPTSLLCGSEGQQQFPILDWTDGTLRLVYANKIPENLPRNRDRSMLHSNQNGIVTDGSTQPPQTWLVPLQLTRLHAIDADRAVGMSIHRDGMSTSIVLMRRAAAPGK